MPAGYEILWVKQVHTTHPEVPMGWGFVPTATATTLKAAGTAIPTRSEPQRYLPHRIRSTFTP